MRVIRCDCGFEVSEHGDDALVTRARDHAWEVHGMDLPTELVLALARPKDLKSTAVDSKGSRDSATGSSLTLPPEDNGEG